METHTPLSNSVSGLEEIQSHRCDFPKIIKLGSGMLIIWRMLGFKYKRREILVLIFSLYFQKGKRIRIIMGV